MSYCGYELPFVDSSRPFDGSLAKFGDVCSRLPIRHPQHFRAYRNKYADLQKRALESSFADDDAKAAIRVASGLIPHCRPHDALMSHRGMRKNAGRYLARELRPFWSRANGRRWFFITLITDIGNSLEYDPVIELERLQRDARKAFALLGLHAIGITEFQLARYPMKGKGRTVEAHIHAVGYTYDQSLTIKGAEAAIAKRRTLFNWLGAPVADLQPINSPNDLKFYCAYMLKPPISESWLVRDGSKGTGFKMNSADDLDPWGAMRLTEILASLTLRNATVARGELVHPKGEWHRRIAQYMRRHPADGDYDYAGAFAALWKNPPVRKPRAGTVIRKDAREPLDLRWRDAMSDWFAEVADNQARHDVRSKRRNSTSVAILRDAIVDDL